VTAPKPAANTLRAKKRRTAAVLMPRCLAMPAATPATIRPSRLRRNGGRRQGVVAAPGASYVGDRPTAAMVAQDFDDGDGGHPRWLNLFRSGKSPMVR
jgi:hypothetical protein